MTLRPRPALSIAEAAGGVHRARDSRRARKVIDAHIISRSVGHTEVTVGTRGSTWVLKAAGMETAVREVLTRPRRPEKMRRALREAVQMGMPVPLSLGPGPGTHWPRPWVCGSSRGKPDRQPDWVLSGTQTTSSDSPPSSLGPVFLHQRSIRTCSPPSTAVNRGAALCRLF